MAGTDRAIDGIRYCILLLAQTIAVWGLIWFAMPIFRQFLAEPGRIRDLTVEDEIAIAGGTIILQISYWVRFCLVKIWVPVQSVFLAHLVKFFGRVSFFFGGALFSTVFFRHIPELDALPPLGQGIARVTLLLTVLFGMFCYSLELDRLGSTMASEV
jgi:hypothetical protein